MERAEALSRSGLLNLSLVYVIWGSTFLAIRVAVRPGAGFPPFTLVFTRVVLAGSILFLIAWLGRKKLRLSRNELVVLAVSGVLLWAGGNGLVVWAEQHVNAGMAALLVATVPLWTAVMDAVLQRESPSALLALSLLVGLGGVGVLSAPSLTSGSGSDLFAILAVILASLVWSLGAGLQRRHSRTESGQVRSAYQHLFGSFGLLFLMVVAGEPAPAPTREAWLAWAFLVVFGSVVGFTAFTTMVNQLPSSVAMTYAYVNPLITVTLGAILLDEPITIHMLAGAALILLGVAGVFRDRQAKANGTARTRMPSEEVPRTVGRPGRVLKRIVQPARPGQAPTTSKLGSGLQRFGAGPQGGSHSR